MPLSMLCCCVCLWVVRERNAVPHTSHQGTLGVWVHKHTFSWLLAVSGALLVVAGYGGEVAAIGTPAVAAGRNGSVCVYFPQDQPTHMVDGLAGCTFCVDTQACCLLLAALALHRLHTMVTRV
jgi:hypothetical protein